MSGLNVKSNLNNLYVPYFLLIPHKSILFFSALFVLATNASAQLQSPSDACIANFPVQKELQILKGKIDLAAGPVSLETLSKSKAKEVLTIFL